MRSVESVPSVGAWASAVVGDRPGVVGLGGFGVVWWFTGTAAARWFNWNASEPTGWAGYLDAGGVADRVHWDTRLAYLPR
jgi:hypothetical protein